MTKRKQIKETLECFDKQMLDLRTTLDGLKISDDDFDFNANFEAEKTVDKILEICKPKPQRLDLIKLAKLNYSEAINETSGFIIAWINSLVERNLDIWEDE